MYSLSVLVFDFTVLMEYEEKLKECPRKAVKLK